MKKQLLIAAVAATMTSAAFADISITGSAKLNYTNSDSTAATNTDATFTAAADGSAIDLGTDGATAIAGVGVATSNVDAADATYSNLMKKELDLTIVGKTGDTSVVLSVSNDTNGTEDTATGDKDLVVENSYVTTSIAGINIKSGQYADTSDSLLTDQDGQFSSGKISLDTTVSGVKIQFEDKNASTSSVTVSGEIAGVKLSHEKHATSTDTKISTDVAGVSVAYRSRDYDAANSDATSLQLSTEVSGVTFTYATIDTDAVHNALTAAEVTTILAGGSDAADLALAKDVVRSATGTVNADAFIAGSGIMEANAFGASMNLAGNTVAVKRMDVTDAQGEDTTNQVTVTRALSNGATFEATYKDIDNASTQADTTSLDLELAVKF